MNSFIDKNVRTWVFSVCRELIHPLFFKIEGLGLKNKIEKPCIWFPIGILTHSGTKLPTTLTSEHGQLLAHSREILDHVQHILRVLGVPRVSMTLPHVAHLRCNVTCILLVHFVRIHRYKLC